MTGLVLLGGRVEQAAGQVDLPRLIVGMSLTSAGGSVSLLGGPYWLANPVLGLSGADSELDVIDLPGLDGTVVQGEDDERAGMSLTAAYPLLTVYVDGGSSLLTAALVADLRRMLSLRRYGPATLSVTRGDGEVRTLAVRHEPKAGDFDASGVGVGDSGRFVTLRLVAPSPFWRGRPGVAGPWYVDTEAGGGLLPADLPFDLAASSVLGQANPVLVEGDEITYPVAHGVGSFDSVEVTRTLDGRTRAYSIANPLPAGEPLTVRHDPFSLLRGQRQIEGPAGVTWAQYLEPGGDLFELRPGAQSITVNASNALAGAAFWLEWETLYWSAVD